MLRLLWSLEICRFSKTLTLIKTEFISFVYIFVHSLKNNFKKKFPWYMLLIFHKLSALLWNINSKKSTTIKVYAEIPSLLTSILGQITTSTKAMKIYKGVGVSFLLVFQDSIFSKSKKNRKKCLMLMFDFSLFFYTSLSFFDVFLFLYLCQAIFSYLSSFLLRFWFLFLTRTFYSTWKKSSISNNNFLKKSCCKKF